MGGMGIPLGVARNVMLAMSGDPELNRPLRSHASEDTQRHPKPGRTLETAVREQAMEPCGQPQDCGGVTDREQHQVRPRHHRSPEQWHGQTNAHRRTKDGHIGKGFGVGCGCHRNDRRQFNGNLRLG